MVLLFIISLVSLVFLNQILFPCSTIDSENTKNKLLLLNEEASRTNISHNLDEKITDTYNSSFIKSITKSESEDMKLNQNV